MASRINASSVADMPSKNRVLNTLTLVSANGVDTLAPAPKHSFYHSPPRSNTQDFSYPLLASTRRQLVLGQPGSPRAPATCHSHTQQHILFPPCWSLGRPCTQPHALGHDQIRRPLAAALSQTVHVVLLAVNCRRNSGLRTHGRACVAPSASLHRATRQRTTTVSNAATTAS